MQTDLQRTNDYATATAAVLEERAASIRTLAGQIGTPITVAFEPVQIERVALIIRSYVGIAASLDRQIEAERARAETAEAACISGMELLAILKTSTLPELIAFWEGQRAKP